MSKVTIVIPVYNGQEWIADAVESAISQTEKCEVIVVNDGSTDNTANVLKDYPVKVIHQVNKGLSSARNTGIMNATTDYVLFLDADDMLQDNCAEKLLSVAEEAEADIVAASFKSFGTENGVVILMPAPTVDDFKVANRIGYSALVRRAALLEVGGYSPRMTYGYEDLHLWFNLLLRGKKLVTLPDVLWLYRTKEHSMIHDAVAHHEELWAQIYKDFPELHD